MNVEPARTALAHKVRRLGHLDLPGAGQVTVARARLCRAHPEPGPSRHLDRRHLRSAQSARRRDRHARRSALAQPQGARRRRHHDRQSRAQHERDRPPRRAAAGRARASLPREARARADARRDCRGAGRRARPTCAELEAAAKRGYHNGGFKIYDVPTRRSRS